MLSEQTTISLSTKQTQRRTIDPYRNRNPCPSLLQNPYMHENWQRCHWQWHQLLLQPCPHPLANQKHSTTTGTLTCRCLMRETDSCIRRCECNTKQSPTKATNPFCDHRAKRDNPWHLCSCGTNSCCSCLNSLGGDVHARFLCQLWWVWWWWRWWYWRYTAVWWLQWWKWRQRATRRWRWLWVWHSWWWT